MPSALNHVSKDVQAVTDTGETNSLSATLARMPPPGDGITTPIVTSAPIFHHKYEKFKFLLCHMQNIFDIGD